MLEKTEIVGIGVDKTERMRRDEMVAVPSPHLPGEINFNPDSDTTSSLREEKGQEEKLREGSK